MILMEYDKPTPFPERLTIDDLATISLSLRWVAMPRHTDSNSFFTKMVRQVLEVTPESYRPEARKRLRTVEPDELPNA